ncbi:MAG: hypothetical protein ACP5OX_00575 [Minisyncoccia bacterium]
MKKITEKTALGELFNNKHYLKVLAKYNVPCLSCPFAIFEIQHLTIKEVCKAYNIDMKKLLKELNKEVKKTTK